MKKIPKSLKGRTRHRIVFWRDTSDSSSSPFWVDKKQEESLWEALNNRHYAIEKSNDTTNGSLPYGLNPNKEYNVVVAWIYLPEDRSNLTELAKLSEVNGWKISHYIPNGRSEIIRGIEPRRRARH